LSFVVVIVHKRVVVVHHWHPLSFDQSEETFGLGLRDIHLLMPGSPAHHHAKITKSGALGIPTCFFVSPQELFELRFLLSLWLNLEIEWVS